MQGILGRDVPRADLFRQNSRNLWPVMPCAAFHSGTIIINSPLLSLNDINTNFIFCRNLFKMVKKLLPGRAFYVFFALLLVCAGNSFVAAQSGDSVGKRDKIIDDNWKLISAGNKTVESLADLTHGVYFLELSGTRLDCDKPSPQGMWCISDQAIILFYLNLYNISVIESQILEFSFKIKANMNVLCRILGI